MSLNRTRLQICLALAILAVSLPLQARSIYPPPPVRHAHHVRHVRAAAPMPVAESEQVKAIMRNLLGDNEAFAKSHGAAYFQPLAAGQAPRATIVTCSDSRVHVHALDQAPDGNLFMVRNIGNQLATEEGSVEYGVRHLHTPLLMFLGHSDCGAIKAAAGDLRAEPRAIRRELATIRIPKGAAGMAGVKMNVNNQVAAALKKFHSEVRHGDLTVVGAVYDFSNELGHGYGKLSVINVNGEPDPMRIAARGLAEVPLTQ